MNKKCDYLLRGLDTDIGVLRSITHDPFFSVYIMRSIYERSSAGGQFKAHKKAKQVSKGLISVADCFKMLFHRIA